jgi:putative ATPase
MGWPVCVARGCSAALKSAAPTAHFRRHGRRCQNEAVTAQEALFADDDGAAAPTGAAARGVPLAERLRPQSLAEVIGQPQLLGPGKPLRLAFESGRVPSLILWGPPGTGKTTLARLLALSTGAHFTQLSAVLAGVKEIREAVEQAGAQRRAGRATVVFVDEVHRFNKAQQDAFLPHVESGLFTFIGATTENPAFEVNSALLSRAAVFVLEPLADADLALLLARAQALLAAPPLTDAARTRLIEHADGDARRLLNAYESAAAAVGTARGASAIDEAALEGALGRLLRRGDKGGDIFYDLISALHKAVRGSSPDAALYWLARLLDAGADPRYAARRIVRMACEDIGLADPRALRLALDAAEVYERLGSPEGELALAEAVTYLAVAPKSNAVYRAWGAVREQVQHDRTRAVPLHLRNAPTKLAKTLGHAAGYRYAHDEVEGYAAGERYLPPELEGRRFYEPTAHGLEQRIAARLAELRALDEQAGPAA